MSAAALLTSLSNTIAATGAANRGELPSQAFATSTLSVTNNNSSSSSSGTNTGGGGCENPHSHGTNLDATLAMLQVLHARVFPAALGVVIHAHEAIFCLRVANPHQQHVATTMECEDPLPSGTDLAPAAAQQTNTGRCIYQVGKHLVFAPPAVYCSCHSFRFQAMQRQDVLFCKHILALRLGLLLDGRDKTDVQNGTSTQLLLPQHRIIRERFIAAEEFAALMMDL